MNNDTVSLALRRSESIRQEPSFEKSEKALTTKRGTLATRAKSDAPYILTSPACLPCQTHLPVHTSPELPATGLHPVPDAPACVIRATPELPS